MALPLIPHYLSEILLGHSDRLMINQMCGTAQAGIYNIVYQISMVMTIIRTGINGSFVPWLYYSIKDKKYATIKRVTRSITILMAIMTLIFMSIGPEILKVVAPPAYYEAVIDIPAIMIGCFFIFVYVLFVNIEIYYEEKHYVAVASIFAAVLNIILNFILMKKWGYLVAGYTTMVSYIAMALLHYIFLRKIIKKYSEVQCFYDIKFIVAISIILILTGILFLYLYNHILLRYFFVIMIGIGCLIKRNILISFIKEFEKK